MSGEAVDDELEEGSEMGQACGNVALYYFEHCQVSFKHIVDGRNNEETRQKELNVDVLKRVFCNCIVQCIAS